MKQFLHPLLADKTIFWGFVFSLVCLLFALFITLVFYQKLPDFVPLYNSLPWGYARLGRKIEIFIPLAIAVVFGVINLMSSAYLYPKMPLLSRIACLTTLTISLLTNIFILKIIFLII